MRILELRQIIRTEEGLYYRRKFSAEAAIETPVAVLELPIHFTIEMGPLGNKEFDIDFLKKPDYPLLPIQKALKKKIEELDKEGKLP